MTKEYAYEMWDRYLTAMKKENTESILVTPFALPDSVLMGDCFDPEKDESIQQEGNLHFLAKGKATANALILRALGQLSFTEEGYDRLVSLLAELTTESYNKA